jgi:hypothetical protein
MTAGAGRPEHAAHRQRRIKLDTRRFRTDFPEWNDAGRRDAIERSGLMASVKKKRKAKINKHKRKKRRRLNRHKKK